MAWSNWVQTAPGEYRTSNLNTASTGRDSFGLPKPPSTPVLPTSSNCDYTVYGVWKILAPDGKFYNPAELLGTIPLYVQRMYQGRIFYWYSHGFPVYHIGRFASFGGVARVDNSIEYGNQNKRCALGAIYHSTYGEQTPFLYGNWDKVDDFEIVFVDIVVKGAVKCDYIFPVVNTNPKLFLGTAAPPPPLPPKKMDCCDCNTIATIIEERLASQNKPIKDHIDQRTIEQLQAINKMLQGMKIDLDLQPVIDRLNEVEANLWNGPKSGG